MRDGGPAFPCKPEFNDIGQPQVHEGMTLRDYFAAKAMTALLTDLDGYLENHAKDIAETAYMMADAMLAARELPPEAT